MPQLQDTRWQSIPGKFTSNKRQPRKSMQCGAFSLYRGDSTAMEFFLEGVRLWESGMRRLLSVESVSEE
jgi:hypothetical protein